MLLFQDKVKKNQSEFIDKVIDISKSLQINPNWLMFVMQGESGLNPQAQNKKYLVQGQPATGLIQFVKSTATNLGTSIDALYKMSNVEQLFYVYKYLKPYTGKMKDVYDVYLAIFFPAAIGQKDDYVFKTKTVSAQKIAKSNPIFDYYKTGVITLAGFKRAMDKRIPEQYKPYLFGESDNSNGINKGVVVFSLLLLTTAAIVYYNRN